MVCETWKNCENYGGGLILASLHVLQLIAFTSASSDMIFTKIKVQFAVFFTMKFIIWNIGGKNKLTQNTDNSQSSSFSLSWRALLHFQQTVNSYLWKEEKVSNLLFFIDQYWKNDAKL